jgi:hypothetical protein
MDCGNLSCDFVKALITGGAFAAVITIVSYIQTRQRDVRDGLFKAFESYLRVMDYREAAVDINTYETWHHYYRAMFDLQWSEFYAWRAGAIPDAPYKMWLQQRMRQYEKGETKVVAKDKKISYKIVWDELSKSHNNPIPYFEPEDDFVAHMKHVHNNKLNKAMSMKNWRKRIALVFFGEKE